MTIYTWKVICFFIFKTSRRQHHGKNDMNFSSLKSPKFSNFELCGNLLNCFKPPFKAPLAKITGEKRQTKIYVSWDAKRLSKYIN